MPLSDDPLFELLRPARLTAVVDIGANPIASDGAPPYQPLLDKRIGTLVGFEPNPEALAELQARKGDLETYLPYALGDGGEGVLRICQASGMTSLFAPEPKVLDCFPLFSQFGRVLREAAIPTRTLDSLEEVPHVDYLKIDIQGSELSVFRNGAAKLSRAVAIHTEVSMVPLYKHQPVFGEVDLALRALGFVPHMIASANKRMILPLQIQSEPYAALNQVLELDMVYVRDFTRLESMESEQLKHLALVAHHAYRSWDLAGRCLLALAEREAIRADALARYLDLLQEPARAAA